MTTAGHGAESTLRSNDETLRVVHDDWFGSKAAHGGQTMKARMGATHFLTKTLPKVAAEMALSVLAYNLTRAMNILGIRPPIAA